MKVCFETFGCRLNRAEALQQEAEYLAKGWERAEKHSEADLFIVRGCSVTRRAQHECERMIAHLKKRYPTVPIRVCGCLKKETAGVLQRGRDLPVAPSPDASAEQPLPVRTARAFLKCQDGCNGKCTFCIVPKFRGASVSLPFDGLVDRAKRFIDAGYREIVLVGCNLSLYASQDRRLPELVSALAELTPSAPADGPLPSDSCRIRIGSLEPGDCATATVDAMAAHANVCRSLHIPVQSGSNAILTAMKRPYLVKDIDELVRRIREKMPLAGIGCDLITGFPGETEVDFSATKGLVKRLAFSNIHVFPYSERPDTLAAGLPNAVSHGTRHKRAHELSALAKHYRHKAMKAFIGHDVDVLIENEEKLTGWTGEYFACEITNKARTQPKRREIVRAHVQDAKEGALKAIMI